MSSEGDDESSVDLLSFCHGIFLQSSALLRDISKVRAQGCGVDVSHFGLGSTFSMVQVGSALDLLDDVISLLAVASAPNSALRSSSYDQRQHRTVCHFAVRTQIRVFLLLTFLLFFFFVREGLCMPASLRERSAAHVATAL